MDRRSLAAACLCWSLAAFPSAFCQEATGIRNNLDPEQENPLASADAQNNRRAKVHRADDAALKKAIDSLSVSESIHGSEHPETAKCLHNLAWCYKSRGDFAAAERDYLRALRIREKSLAAEDPATASTVYNLAALYRQQGKLAAAEPLYLRALKINEKSLGAEHPNTAKCLNGLANLYKNQGNFVAMEQSLLRALSIQERALSPGHPEIGRTLGDLAGCYKKQGKREQAVQMYQRALRTMELSSDRNDPAIANLLNNMAEVSPSPNAERLLQRALQINETSLGPNDPAVSASLANLATIYTRRRDYQQAEILYERGLKIREETLGPDHPRTAKTLDDLALFHWRHGDPVKARQLAARTVKITRTHLEKTAAIQSEQQQMQMQADANARFSWDNWMTITSLDSTAQEAWNAILPWKGLVTARQMRLRRQLQHDPLWNEYRQATQQLSEVVLSPPMPPSNATKLKNWRTQEKSLRQQWQSEVQRLTENSERLEKELANRSTDFRQWQQSQLVRATDVIGSMAKEQRPTALVDLIAYFHMGRGDEPRERRLSAFVVRSDREVVRIELGSVASIRDAIDQWRLSVNEGEDGFDSGKILREKLWEPLSPALEGIETVLISPDAAIAQLPWGALPGSAPGTYLLEERAFAIIPAPQFLPEILARPVTEETPKSLLVVSEIDYSTAPGIPSDQLVATIPERQQEGTSNQGIRHFPPLKHANREQRSIVSLYSKANSGAVVKVMENRDATKAAFQQAAIRYSYLHLITHGFFAPKIMISPNPSTDRDTVPFVRVESEGEPVEPHPGLLSGLAFAGANNPPETGGNDGILTALEVAALDFGQAEMVVLSACDTGLGPSAGREGLLGLQRAFQIAGAKSCVASLWSVDDAATQALMIELYRNLWERKLSRIDALRQAQLTMLESFDPGEGLVRGTIGKLPGKSTNNPPTETRMRSSPRVPPRYWAAFVLSGDWR